MIPFGNIGFYAPSGQSVEAERIKTVTVGGRTLNVTEVDTPLIEIVKTDSGLPMWVWGVGGALLVGVLLFTFVKD